MNAPGDVLCIPTDLSSASNWNHSSFGMSTPQTVSRLQMWELQMWGTIAAVAASPFASPVVESQLPKMQLSKGQLCSLLQKAEHTELSWLFPAKHNPVNSWLWFFFFLFYFFSCIWEKAAVFEWIKQHFWLDCWQCSFSTLEVSLSALLADALTSSMQKCVVVQFATWSLE